jgi:acylphosphatase
MQEYVRAHAVVHGRVQGVFFRMETAKAAKKIGVFGWVKNRLDGSVEAVFEGDRSRVDQILKWCEKGPPLSEVKNLDVKWETATREYRGFEITY